MATNLNPATSTFGTNNLIGETGDVFPSTTWAQMADNTGFNWYTLRHICTQTTEILRTASNETETNMVYMAVGTYVAYASSYFDLENSSSAQGTIRLAGTDIIAEDGGATGTSGWFNGSAEVIIDTTAWVAAEYNAIGAAGNKSTVKNTTLYFHRGTGL